MTLLIGSLAPVAILVGIIYYFDRKQPEPPAQLAKAVFYGAISAIIALILSLLLGIPQDSIGCGEDGNPIAKALYDALFGDLREIGDDHYYGRNGNPIDYDKAKLFYEEAADLGDVRAINYLGNYCFKGINSACNYGKAILYYKSAANNGSIEALDELNG